MMNRIKNLWTHHRLLLLALVVAVVSFGFFGVRTMTATMYWMDPAHQDQPLAGWMTPRYVAQSYKLPPEYLGPAMFLDQDERPRRISLDAIAAENDMTLDDLQVRIDAAAAEWRALDQDRANDE